MAAEIAPMAMAIPAIHIGVRSSPAILQPRRTATTGLSKPRKAVVLAARRAQWPDDCTNWPIAGFYT